MRKTNKNKTISFRVNEQTFESLQHIAKENGMSLSTVFRDYVRMFVERRGQVRVVPEDPLTDSDAGFPPRIEVPTSFLRDHERLELEAGHLREQLAEYKRYISALREREAESEVIFLEDLDAENDAIDSWNI
ncbi:MAG TPA: ribbon-helix-helix protein, CopG family [Halobacteriales archaeon]|jgi:antitoxin component of RelBE/YafQ-DinJ toxin-antitoxin module|uniref:ribbon-helix-helix protein, CopG family n=1 Tax=Candidatus Hikarchaeum yamanae TaxID=2675326 RepID=UPI0017CDFE29|nr:ribbon-helix-helix protein, CopG family [Halobacteriales archaeon]HIJ12562.1 ribbon-helix-helix protein, CopG family [Halobacteriales archaeon]|tara:strand:+ start:2446 stop:2841 length:396 start_codon:yes stop_codon:yes gene_type:complete